MAKKSPQVEHNHEGRTRSSGLVITALCVGFLALVATNWKEHQKIQRVSVDGVSELSGTSVHAIVDSLQFKQIKKVALADVRLMVMQCPFVKSATVFIDNVRDLHVQITERVPVAHIVLESGELRYVDADGTILPASVKRVAHNVPVLQQSNGMPLTQKQRAASVAVITNASRTLSQALYNSISEVRIQAQSNNLDFITADHSWCLGNVYRGTISEALADMNTFWTNTLCKGLCSDVQEIDLRWNRHVVVRYHKPVSAQVIS